MTMGTVICVDSCDYTAFKRWHTTKERTTQSMKCTCRTNKSTAKCHGKSFFFFTESARVVDFFFRSLYAVFVGARVFSFVLVHRFHHENSNTSIVLAILCCISGMDVAVCFDYYVSCWLRACGFAGWLLFDVRPNSRRRISQFCFFRLHSNLDHHQLVYDNCFYFFLHLWAFVDLQGSFTILILSRVRWIHTFLFLSVSHTLWLDNSGALV